MADQRDADLDAIRRIADGAADTQTGVIACALGLVEVARSLRDINDRLEVIEGHMRPVRRPSGLGPF